MRICCQNVRSLHNKTAVIHDLLDNDKWHIFILTESWLTPNDNFTLRLASPTNYSYHNVPRNTGKRGGGIAVLYRNDYELTVDVNDSVYSSTSFEFCFACVRCGNVGLNVVTIYRPPDQSIAIFFNEFSEFLEILVCRNQEFIIVGDFNLHLDVSENSATRRFIDLLNSFALKQFVQSETHSAGHMLDLFIARETLTEKLNVDVQDFAVSDHRAVTCTYDISLSRNICKLKNVRNYRAVNIEHFLADIERGMSCLVMTGGADVCINDFNSCLQNVLDCHAPLSRRKVKDKHVNPWFSSGLRRDKQRCRKLERCWRNETDPELSAGARAVFVKFRSTYTEAVKHEKMTWYSSRIKNCNNQRELYTIVNNINKSNESLLPTATDMDELAERFQNYFLDKISDFQKNFNECSSPF